MSIYTVVILSLLVCIVILTLKNHNPSVGFIVSVAFSSILLIVVMPKLNSILHTLNNVSAKAGIGSELFTVLIKCLGITYLTEWGENFCKDAGQNALSLKIQLFGKIGIVIIIIPIIEEILNNIISIIK